MSTRGRPNPVSKVRHSLPSFAQMRSLYCIIKMQSLILFTSEPLPSRGGRTFAKTDGIGRLDLDLDSFDETRLNPLPILSCLLVLQLRNHLRRSDESLGHAAKRGEGEDRTGIEHERMDGHETTASSIGGRLGAGGVGHWYRARLCHGWVWDDRYYELDCLHGTNLLWHDSSFTDLS